MPQLTRSIAALAFLLTALSAPAAIFHRSRASVSKHASGVSSRKRLHVNDLITEPGTVELDFGGLYSYTTGALTAPSALKYTPDGDSLFWGRTEYSVAFDSVSTAINAGLRPTQFSDRLTFAATSVLYDSEHFDVAVAPQVTAFLRGDSGIRIGAGVIARYDKAGNSAGVAMTWTAGTKPSDTNPSGIWDLGFGYGRQLASRGPLSPITAHFNWVIERGTGFERTQSGFFGFEYQATKRFAIDLTAQRYNFTGGVPDRQVLLSTTVNFGRVN